MNRPQAEYRSCQQNHYPNQGAQAAAYRSSYARNEAIHTGIRACASDCAVCLPAILRPTESPLYRYMQR